ncbi:tRNA wybutosine-synthesizing protein 2/3/4-like isoform X1 [Malania oleifera]|uniref:tRNA wybutosine-synthesizing protein 2/3/4-like isoform X1 n=1 Tax=Malania oleifera TaxID=397392 RepID=UPI0025ADE3F7|nr:tRNA wybutosine-synthesizing protein 2/3/4-like isoform X1 [Malania oleifera]XP_057960654.1 tRNA wybutosine-synthesizing protein 2/3/4-like isoform X1 [Malania oleifera]
MEFEERKALALAAMGEAESDKSPEGTLDTLIIPILNTLNSHPSFFTTSSCSGRISILSQPAIPTTKSKKAKGGFWLFITHDPADPDLVTDLLFPAESTQPSAQHSDLVFRFEPFIVAVECRDVGSAQSLVSTAISCGFRESGITSAHKRVIVAIRCSIRLEVPLGDTCRMMVSPEYVRYLVGIANEKMEANRGRTEGFLQALRRNGFVGNEIFSNTATEDDKNGSVCSEGHACSVSQDQDSNLPRTDTDTYFGSSEFPGCNLSVAPMAIAGQPLEKLFLWGHSACTLYNTSDSKILVFGGFGGMGRHTRRNDSLLLDPISGKLKSLDTEDSPSPRLGHTSSLVEHSMFVIGGRADPTKILNDVWAFMIAENKWKLLKCTGCFFPPRHRHAAAAIGSKIYVFGGLNNDIISSSLHVLDTDDLQWSEICVHGEWPSARHSHSLVAYGSQLFMFGGYNREKPLGDLYSFSIQTCLWKKEKMAGKPPHARFSHSMFAYKNYLGIIGGCPVRQHCQELALFDMRLRLWKHVILNSIGKDLFVRSTANVVGDDLVVIGGGASCYAFGTKFSEPVRVNLLPLMTFDNILMPSETGAEHAIQFEQVMETKAGDFQHPQNGVALNLTKGPSLNIEADLSSMDVGHKMVASQCALQLERKYAKLGKDILKKFGWLDLGRKAYSQEDGMHICFPVSENFCNIFPENQHQIGDSFEGLNDPHLFKPYIRGGVSLNNVSSLTALNLLMACGASKIADEVVEIRRAPKSPLQIMGVAVASLIKRRGLSEQLLKQLPARWERLGDIVVLPVACFKDPQWDSIVEELWPTVAKSLNTRRLARQGRVAPTGTRDSTLEILLGDGGWVDHCENGILYSFNVTKCMFSWGNLSEKIRMGQLDCRDEVIVDLFAGIGYFVLPFLVRAKAKLVYACEWNPYAVEALQHNLQANSVSDRCIILEGDNWILAPKGVADRVCLGLLPTSEGSWVTAVRALRAEGGILHLHGNVKDSEEVLWTDHISKSIHEIAQSEGYCWEISIDHVERVKWYAPHIRHLVADVRCRQIQR